MSFASSLRTFTSASDALRVSAFGQAVTLGTTTISAIVYPLSKMEQEAGGYERDGTVRLETLSPLTVHNLVVIKGVNHRVSEVKRGEHSAIYSATLEVAP